MASATDRWLHELLLDAAERARLDGSHAIEARHLLLALASGDAVDGSTRRLLASVGLDADGVRAALEREFERSLSVVGVSTGAYDLNATPSPERPPRLGTSGKLALERGFHGVRKRDLRPGHLLLGVLSARVGTVARALDVAGIDRESLVERLRAQLAKESRDA